MSVPGRIDFLKFSATSSPSAKIFDINSSAAEEIPGEEERSLNAWMDYVDLERAFDSVPREM